MSSVVIVGCGHGDEDGQEGDYGALHGCGGWTNYCRSNHFSDVDWVWLHLPVDHLYKSKWCLGLVIMYPKFGWNLILWKHRTRPSFDFSAFWVSQQQPAQLLMVSTQRQRKPPSPVTFLNVGTFYEAERFVLQPQWQCLAMSVVCRVQATHSSVSLWLIPQFVGALWFETR